MLFNVQIWVYFISLQYFGGTNFERTAGGPLQITSYDYDAPIDEYGMYKSGQSLLWMYQLLHCSLFIREAWVESITCDIQVS
jgi:hypothetical protein